MFSTTHTKESGKTEWFSSHLDERADTLAFHILCEDRTFPDLKAISPDSEVLAVTYFCHILFNAYHFQYRYNQASLSSEKISFFKQGVILAIETGEGHIPNTALEHMKKIPDSEAMEQIFNLVAATRAEWKKEPYFREGGSVPLLPTEPTSEQSYYYLYHYTNGLLQEWHKMHQPEQWERDFFDFFRRVRTTHLVQLAELLKKSNFRGIGSFETALKLLEEAETPLKLKDLDQSLIVLRLAFDALYATLSSSN